jgi:hypothetical protein
MRVGSELKILSRDDSLGRNRKKLGGRGYLKNDSAEFTFWELKEPSYIKSSMSIASHFECGKAAKASPHDPLPNSDLYCQVQVHSHNLPILIFIRKADALTSMRAVIASCSVTTVRVIACRTVATCR